MQVTTNSYAVIDFLRTAPVQDTRSAEQEPEMQA